jgi:hypothetical protein
MIGFGWWRNHEAGAAWWQGLWPGWVRWQAAVAPAALAVVFGLWAWRKAVRLGPGPRAAEKIARYGALWLALYACAWLVGQAYNDEALILGVLAMAGFLGMTVLREAFALIEQPMGYRR